MLDLTGYGRLAELTKLTDRMTAEVATTLGTLTPEVRRKVLHDTAARVYNLA